MPNAQPLINNRQLLKRFKRVFDLPGFPENEHQPVFVLFHPAGGRVGLYIFQDGRELWRLKIS